MRATWESGESGEPGASRAKESGLMVAALLAALLGLTLLDVAPSPVHKQASADASRSIDCIVASAVFAGVSGATSAPMP